MRGIGIVSILAFILSLSAWFCLPSMAQNPEIKTTSIQLPGNVPAILYEPVTPGVKSHITVFLAHPGGGYLHFSACTELSKRGYRVLCTANSVGNAINIEGIDRKILDMKAGVAFLREYPGVQKIVLLGHSGGGMLISAYQNIAENGLKACQGPEKIVKCPDNLAGMPAADGVMLLDAHWGDAVVSQLFALNPFTGSGAGGNAGLDPYSPENGYDVKGSNYTDEFLRKYFAQVGKIINGVIQDARTKYAAVNGDKGGSHDGDLFSVPIGRAARLYELDSKLLSHTHGAWPLLHPDGSMTTQIVYSVRPAGGQGQGLRGPGSGRMPQAATGVQGGASGPGGGPGADGRPEWQGGPGAGQGSGPGGPGGDGGPGGPGAKGGPFRLREFLNTYAIRVNGDFGYGEDSVRGIDWTSNYVCPISNVKGITVPLLAMGMTGSYEFMSTELNYENAQSSDKTIGFVEGASHMFSTCTQCEKVPGQYGDTMKTLYDYLDKWLSAKGRFM